MGQDRKTPLGEAVKRIKSMRERATTSPASFGADSKSYEISILERTKQAVVVKAFAHLRGNE